MRDRERNSLRETPKGLVAGEGNAEHMHCGMTLPERARTCPDRRGRIRGMPALGASIIVLVILAIIATVTYLSDSASRQMPGEDLRSLGDLELLGQMKLLRSLDEKNHIAYVDSYWWMRYGKDVRRTAANVLANHCDKKMKDGKWVKIVEKYSGILLAEINSEAGYVVHH